MPKVELVSQIVMWILASGSALAGVFLSNKLLERSTEKQNKLQSLKHQQERLRSSGEELYNLVANWATLVFTSHISLYAVMRGEVSYNDHLDQYNSRDSKNIAPIVWSS